MIRESDFQDVTAINEGILLRIGGEEDRSSDRQGEVKPVGGPEPVLASHFLPSEYSLL